MARRLIGQALQLGLPTNSLKLMAYATRHHRDYIWIDPPWELLRGDLRLVRAADYTSSADSDYLPRHTEWGSRVRLLLDGAVLTDVAALPDGSAEFVFARDLILRVVATETEPDESRWYDDWYAKG